MKRAINIILMAGCVAIASGCAKEKSRVATPPAPTELLPPRGGDVPVTPNGNGSGDPSLDSEVEFVPKGTSAEARRRALQDFFSSEPVNNPTNIRIGMNVSREGNGWGGEVWIRFEDNGRTRTAVLSTQHPDYAGTSDASHNIWFNHNGKQVFHGFFQDVLGAVVVVIDDTLSLGDGQASELLGGSVWFQNFSAYYWPPQGPAKMCWQIDIGPYDCRTFIVGGQVVTTSALYPNNYGNESDPPRMPYRMLGTFSSLPRSAAFIE